MTLKFCVGGDNASLSTPGKSQSIGLKTSGLSLGEDYAMLFFME